MGSGGERGGEAAGSHLLRPAATRPRLCLCSCLALSHASCRTPALLPSRPNRCSEAYGVLSPDGIALRGLFIIDKEGVVQHSTINNLAFGRNVDETLRTLQALQYVQAHPDEVCPAGWKPGQKTMKPAAAQVRGRPRGLGVDQDPPAHTSALRPLQPLPWLCARLPTILLADDQRMTCCHRPLLVVRHPPTDITRLPSLLAQEYFAAI